MPYNTTPIEPGHEPTGTANLPLARTKKIINNDDDISHCSANASFAITIATELFIQHLVSQTHNVLKLEKKPRRQVAYKDVATAVAKHDNLEFLTDVVPRTVSYKVFKSKKGRMEKNTIGAEEEAEGLAVRGKGQRTLAGMVVTSGGPKGKQSDEHADVNMADVDSGYEEEQDEDAEGEGEEADVGVTGSPRSVRNVGTRYDAVRGDFEGGGRVEKYLPMEEY